mmetsp:Transcript_12186/g.23849  ORF Transcript_12186/g.23849 Transcript_12186/m.23849 type:complete len:409 (-) Transcript_12186:112-1338(-)
MLRQKIVPMEITIDGPPSPKDSLGEGLGDLLGRETAKEISSEGDPVTSKKSNPDEKEAEIASSSPADSFQLITSDDGSPGEGGSNDEPKIDPGILNHAAKVEEKKPMGAPVVEPPFDPFAVDSNAAPAQPKSSSDKNDQEVDPYDVILSGKDNGIDDPSEFEKKLTPEVPPESQASVDNSLLLSFPKSSESTAPDGEDSGPYMDIRDFLGAGPEPEGDSQRDSTPTSNNAMDKSMSGSFQFVDTPGDIEGDPDRRSEPDSKNENEDKPDGKTEMREKNEEDSSRGSVLDAIHVVTTRRKPRYADDTLNSVLSSIDKVVQKPRLADDFALFVDEKGSNGADEGDDETNLTVTPGSMLSSLKARITSPVALTVGVAAVTTVAVVTIAWAAGITPPWRSKKNDSENTEEGK